MDRDVQAVGKAILCRGLDDWVHIAEVVLVARQVQSGKSLTAGYPVDSTIAGEELRRIRNEWLARREREALPLGIDAVKHLLRDELVRIGEISDSGFVPWNGRIQDIEHRIDRVVEEAIYPLLPGHLFWIENTPAGDDVARASGEDLVEFE